jgi:hypothetical protein
LAIHSQWRILSFYWGAVDFFSSFPGNSSFINEATAAIALADFPRLPTAVASLVAPFSKLFLDGSSEKCRAEASGRNGCIRRKQAWGLCPQTPGIYRMSAKPGAEGDGNGHPAVLLIITMAPGLA